MAIVTKVVASTTRDEAQIFLTFPVGCRLGRMSYVRKEATVDIPYADGAKDVSDGKRGIATIAVEGKVTGSPPGGLEYTFRLIMNTLLDHADDYYVGVSYEDGGTPDVDYWNRVHHLAGADGTPDGPTAMRWMDVHFTFTCLDPEYVTHS